MPIVDGQNVGNCPKLTVLPDRKQIEIASSRTLHCKLKVLSPARYRSHIVEKVIQIWRQCLITVRYAVVITGIHCRVPRRVQRVLRMRQAVRARCDRQASQSKICIGLFVQVSCWSLHTHTITFFLTFLLKVVFSYTFSLGERCCSAFLFILNKCTRVPSHLDLLVLSATTTQ